MTQTSDLKTADAAAVTTAILAELPPVIRWTASVQRLLRSLPIGLDGKASGHEATDALTIADLTSQTLLLSCLRDGSPLFRQCRLYAEEESELVDLFARSGELVIGLDPLDGTQAYRDGLSADYAIILTLRNDETVLLSLLFLPEEGAAGSWLVVRDGDVYFGPDDLEKDAVRSVRELPRLVPSEPGRRVYLSSFAWRDPAFADQVRTSGYEPVGGGDRNLWLKMALGEVTGAVVDTPNVYDFPAGLHVARVRGGDGVWLPSRERVHFRDLWWDERAKCVRLHGLVAFATEPAVLADLTEIASDWSHFNPRSRPA
ncbi:MAG: inositol monophosphatase [Chloroflexi bacterium]|nr:inositol monophosphatase [Chloroflexota bacterium]